jgi:4-hydroxybenzoate polyprenyltransferase
LAPFLVAVAATTPPLTLLSLLVLLVLSAGYNAPPTRLKGRPILDSLTNVLYAIPLQVGLHAAGSTNLVDAPVLVFAAWGIGAHALTTITDRDEDAAAGVRTIAVLLGRRNTALFAAAWFTLVGFGIATITGTPAAALLALPYLALCFIGRDARGEAGRRLYRLFLITNVALGASITMMVLLSVSVDAAIPAGILAMAGTAIALGVSVGRAVLQRR